MTVCCSRQNSLHSQSAAFMGFENVMDEFCSLQKYVKERKDAGSASETDKEGKVDPRLVWS